MARLKIEWSLEAKNDLISILNYFLVRNKSATYSKKLNKKINAAVKLLSINPDLGIKTDLENVRYFIGLHQKTGDYLF